MIGTDFLTFHEVMTHEPLPVSTIHQAVIEFLRNRDDAVMFGAQAVNAYVGEPRMTQDVDIVSHRARELATELQEFLSGKFRIAMMIREIGEGRGFRLYQLRNEGNRHLVDLRSVSELPSVRRIEELLVIEPAELIACKVIAYHQRKGTPKSGTDWRDLALLLLTFPQLKTATGVVRQCLVNANASEDVLSTWDMLVQQNIKPEAEDDF
jgi:hypothetical protein